MTAQELQIDVRGMLCPEPLKVVRNKIREIDSGDSLRIFATDPTTQRDFRTFCHFMGHQLVVENQEGETFEFVILKG